MYTLMALVQELNCQIEIFHTVELALCESITFYVSSYFEQLFQSSVSSIEIKNDLENIALKNVFNHEMSDLFHGVCQL